MSGKRRSYQPASLQRDEYRNIRRPGADRNVSLRCDRLWRSFRAQPVHARAGACHAARLGMPPQRANQPMSDPPPTLAQLLNRSRELYSLPAVAVKVLELTGDPFVAAAELKNCIENDPALTIKVLRVVNSSLFGLGRPVSDLNSALALLGTKPLKLLVLGFSLPEPLFSDIAGDILGRYWKRTLTRAVAAREISQRIWRLPGDEAFIAGLLKDLGQLVLIQGLGKPYVAFVRRADVYGDALRDLERRAIGFDHIQLTTGLLSQWKLPRSLVEAVSASDPSPGPDDNRSTASALPRTLHLAELLAGLLAEQRAELLPELLQAGRRYQVGEQTMTEIAADLEEIVGHLADVLSLQLPVGMAYQDVFVRAHAQSARAAEELVTNRRDSRPSPTDDVQLLDELRSLSSAAADLATRPQARQRMPTAPDTISGSSGAEPAQAGWQRPARRDPPLANGASHGGGLRTAEDANASEGAESALEGRLAAAVIACREARQPLSLLLAELDRYEDLVFCRGAVKADERCRKLESACRCLVHSRASLLRVAEARFALVLPACDRRAAVESGNGLLRLLKEREFGLGAARVSVGAATVALPPRNFSPQDLVDRCQRCLHAAQLSGGNCVKSIELY